MTLTAPARPATRRTVVLAALAGVVLAVVWSPELVDDVIAGNLARPVLGTGDLETVPLTDSTGAMVFAFVTGVAGMFTACNIAVFSALAPLSADSAGVAGRALLRPVGLLVAGAVAVSGLYGAIGVYLGDGSAQLSGATLGDTGLPVRLVQAAVVFVLIGAVMTWRGLAYAGIAPHPLGALVARRPWVETLVLGGLIGAFVVGRPFPPFRHLYAYAASTDDPLLGFATFALQSLGNVAGVLVLLLVVGLAAGGRLGRWLAASPGRSARVSAAAFVTVGVFFLVYWGVKIAARAGVGWFPTMPWNG